MLFYLKIVHILNKWSKNLPNTKNENCYLNFIASHDGIGIRPTEGLLNKKTLNNFLNRLKKNGSKFSYRKVQNKAKKVYEANITVFDALKKSDYDIKGKFYLERYISCHAIMISFEGIPAIYFNSIFGTSNDEAKYIITGNNRDVNRYRWNKNKNLDKALELCKLNENSSDKSIIYNFIGVIHFMKKNLAEAEKFFKVIEIDNKFQDPIRNLCVIYAITKKFKELLNYSTKLYYLDSKNPLNIFQIASANELNKNYDEAIKYYEKYINTDGSDKKRGFNNIGNIYLRKGKPKTSIKYFSKALELDSNNKILINNILLCYLSLRDENKAEEYFKRAEIIDSNYTEFLHNKAEFLILKNQIDEAEKILENNKGNTKFLITLIRLYFNSGQNTKGNELLNQSREILKNNSDFYNYLGIRYLYEGNFDEGWKYYEFRKSKLSNFFKNIDEWNGANINNKSIVVYNEQGLGDSIQFSKYLITIIKSLK